MNPFHAIAILLATALAAWPAAADTPEFKGFRVCAKCHDAQGDAWKGTAHAKAFESLKPGVKAEAKTRAGLDPAAGNAEAQARSAETHGRRPG